jgi:hypothetical protein
MNKLGYLLCICRVLHLCWYGLDCSVSSVDELLRKASSFDPGFLEKNEFRDFYRFVFQFSREGTKKTIGTCHAHAWCFLTTLYCISLHSIEKEVIASLLPIVLDRNRAPHLEYFLQVLFYFLSILFHIALHSHMPGWIPTVFSWRAACNPNTPTPIPIPTSFSTQSLTELSYLFLE